MLTLAICCLMVANPQTTDKGGRLCKTETKTIKILSPSLHHVSTLDMKVGGGPTAWTLIPCLGYIT